MTKERTEFSIWVPGIPRSKGSMVGIVNQKTGKVKLIPDSKLLVHWIRKVVKKYQALCPTWLKEAGSP